MDVFDFLKWLLANTLTTAAAIGVLGFVFREKWKQMLTRSLAQDLEKLKAELQRESAEHAASLTPQIEQAKAEFQHKLEAYKVSLIAEAEHAKALADLKKSIALKYTAIQFDRLVSLEKALSPFTWKVCGMGAASADSEADWVKYVGLTEELATLMEEAGMFLESSQMKALMKLRIDVHKFATDYIHSGRLGATAETTRPLLKDSAECILSIRKQIMAIGMLPTSTQPSPTAS